MNTLYLICLFVIILHDVIGTNLRCAQKGGTSGSCDKVISGFMYSTSKKSCFALKLKGCETLGKFFENKSDCQQCVS
ncbi:hypothetical protein M5D96_004958 [Drosophila gunungcola]|uniref:BPTI/Kunitz inhibitor domain-containing protein n=1 Tax=Drosophila gunungcola TaxID=103775 RepID=A0A9Q0BTS1_9MUSC|nr:hypothetical protein M5D96_004958 [Drosophila gunungcola]